MDDTCYLLVKIYFFQEQLKLTATNKDRKCEINIFESLINAKTCISLQMMCDASLQATKYCSKKWFNIVAVIAFIKKTVQQKFKNHSAYMILY